MKYFILLFSLFVILALGVSDALAQSSVPSFTDTVVKIKEDDDGKLIVLKKASQVLYLKNSAPNFEAVFSNLENSLAFGSSIKIITDGKLNVLKAE
jgi:hypothetical protein